MWNFTHGKHSTAKQYGFIVKRYIVPELGEAQLCDLRREHLQPFLAAKIASGLSWETVAHIRNVLKKILDAAVDTNSHLPKPHQQEARF